MPIAGKTIFVTGGNGFLGKHVCSRLTAAGARVVSPNSKAYNLTRPHDVNVAFRDINPDIVIHLAATVGGIGINRDKPGTFFYNNLMMGILLLEEARKHNLEKFVCVGTVCSFPMNTPVPFKETDLWNGYPEPSNAAYGIAKKALLVQAQAYKQEFGLNSIYLLPVNLYGPGDNFDPASSHVIPALIRKCIDARNNNTPTVECWGTGMATREFLYVEDAAEAIVLATDKYNSQDPVNIGSGREISIASLVGVIAKGCRYLGHIVFNNNYPDGQPRRCLDTTKAKEEFGFVASTSFENGLAKTIDWYERQRS